MNIYVFYKLFFRIQRFRCVLTARYCNSSYLFNTLRPRQNGHHFTEDIFKCIFFNENVTISIKISLKFVPIYNIPALVQIMAWRRPGKKPLSAPMMVSSLMHICVTRPQWVNVLRTHIWTFISCSSFALNKMVTILQTWCLIVFSLMKIPSYWFQYLWCLFIGVQLTLC